MKKNKNLTIKISQEDLKVRDIVYTDFISKRPHATITPTKKEKQNKLFRKYKNSWKKDF